MTDSQSRTIATLPHALEAFDQVERAIGGRTPAFFFDYDGTLTPIVPRPEDAILSAEGRTAIKALAERYTVAVVSGRDRPVVEDLVGVDGLVYAGSHGFDIAVPGDSALKSPITGDFTALLDTVEARLHDALGALDGAQIERKKFSIAAHNRNVAEADQHRVEDTVKAILADHPDELKVTPGKCVFEIQPNLDWDKGKCLLWLIDALGVGGADHVPVFTGDDVTDEHALAALAEHGAGLGVVVADRDEANSRASHADFRVDTPDQLYEFLERLAG